jgi:chorismate-pyruvate lyase
MSLDQRGQLPRTDHSPVACPPSPKDSPSALAQRHFTLQAGRPAHLAEIDLAELDHGLRALLFTDGTVTRTLEAQTLSPVSVEVVSQEQMPIPGGMARHLGVAGGTPAVRRRVSIALGEAAAPVIWAESHIVPSRLPGNFLDVLGDASEGIGESLQQVQLESWREMLWFGADRVPAWSGSVTPNDPMAITRLYRVIAGGKPGLLISETFTVRREAGMYHLHPAHG